MGKIVCYKKNGRLIPISNGDDYTSLSPVYSDSVNGKFVVQHSLITVTQFILNNMFEEFSLNVQHTYSGGLYCEILSRVLLSESDIEIMNSRLKEAVGKSEALSSSYKSREELIKLFADNDKKRTLIENSTLSGAFYVEYNGIRDFFNTPLVPSTDMLSGAFYKWCPPGIVIYAGEEFKKDEQKKLFNVYLESENWAKILNWESVSQFDRTMESGEYAELIHVAEALHEKKIVEIAGAINERRGRVKVVTIAGPSSSGKTTFLKRLTVQLRVLGISSAGISLDNYFVDREKTPLDENGNPDYESIDAIDTDLFNEHLLNLVEGKSVRLPVFDFTLGKRKPGGVDYRIDKNDIIIIEGIHGLNEKLTSSIRPEMKLKIYVSALTQINIDDTHRISTTDNRLIRRIVRDYFFRNHSAEQTFEMWKSVRRGEEKNIFPFQESADYMFNSSLLYEFSVMKSFAEPLLSDIKEDKPFYTDAQRLVFMLSFFKPISIEMIPRTSVIREFIGGSSFTY